MVSTRSNTTTGAPKPRSAPLTSWAGGRSFRQGHGCRIPLCGSQRVRGTTLDPVRPRARQTAIRLAPNRESLTLLCWPSPTRRRFALT
jgi:hypothetical protein